MAIFAGLFAFGNFIAIPGFASFESVVTFISAMLFGPYITMIAALAGEAILLPIAPPSENIFIFSTFIGDALTALIMGFGRRLAFPIHAKIFKGKPEKLNRARMTGETVAYIIAIAVRYTFYDLYNAIFLYAGIMTTGESAYIAWVGFTIANTVRMIYKMLLFPLCIIITESVRKALNKVYFNLKPVTMLYNQEK
ncbi:MAG: hypothetical protein ACTSWN_07100 [Promethearchaeota archaeon]